MNPSAPPPALEVVDLHHVYGSRTALAGVTLAVPAGEIFGLLGPNGGGKTTLFRIAATLVRPTRGTVRVFGTDVMDHPLAVRRRLGVVFQAPALDTRLTVAENLRHHARLHGLRAGRRSAEILGVLKRVRLDTRADDLVGTLSGGLRRRAEIAKALLPSPDLLILDEPSTGLDPTARRELWDDLKRLRDQERTTIVVTTHLMAEGAACDRVGILNEGRLVALGTPAELVDGIGGEVMVISSASPASLRERLRSRFGLESELVDGHVRLERPRAHELVTTLVEAFPGEIDAITFGRPTLEDVFVHHTGQQWKDS